MVLSLFKFVVLVNVCICTAVDLTLLPAATGPYVVEASISKLDNAFSNENPFWDIRQSTFIRTLAFVESMDGVRVDGVQQGFEGIWRVDINTLTTSKPTIERLDRGLLVMEEINRISPSSGIPDWDSIFDIGNMDIPLYSCMAARLYLLFSSELFRAGNAGDCSSRSNEIFPPSEIIQIGEYWHQCYHQQDASLSPNTFSTEYQNLLTAENGIGIII